MLGNLNDKFQDIDLEKIDIEGLPELERFMFHKIYSLNTKFKKYFQRE